MRINQLTLRNFGLYRGEQTLSLKPRPKSGGLRPIVLIGGQNGAGKTTILEAIRVCLYGRLALGLRTSEAEYQSFLHDKIHRNKAALIPISYASVALEFEYAHGGVRSTYLVHRAWESKGTASVIESLRVLRDGQPLADVESQFWSEFIRSLIPPGVSQLFFFDGERIMRLAEEETEAVTLGESVKSLLGLDIVERLQADLDLYNSRYLKKTVTGALANRLQELESTDEKLQTEVRSVQTAEQSATSRLAELADAIAQTERQLAQRGEGLSAQRGKLRNRKVQLEERREQVERALRDECEKILPFAICGALSQKLVEQLRQEAALESWRAGRVEAQRALDAVSSRVINGEVAARLGLAPKLRNALASEIAALATELGTVPSALAAIRPVHEFSERVRHEAIQTLESALGETPTRIAELTKELEATIAELREVQEHLNRAPEADEVAPFVKQLSLLQEEQAKLSLELTLKSEDRSRLEKQVTILANERARILKTQSESHSVARRLALAASARKALDEYLKRLTVAKVDELEKVALDCFQTLSRKSDLVQRLSINPLTFEVTLFDREHQRLPKALLSAGEKQIYAVALLWGLARVSGRALPMIIDTPLGRLDTVHRKHLLERYFPAASHQVIILSTDTEINAAYVETLRPNMSHSLHLVNHSDGWTEATPGYFWHQEEVADVGA